MFFWRMDGSFVYALQLLLPVRSNCCYPVLLAAVLLSASYTRTLYGTKGSRFIRSLCFHVTLCASCPFVTTYGLIVQHFFLSSIPTWHIVLRSHWMQIPQIVIQ